MSYLFGITHHPYRLHICCYMIQKITKRTPNGVRFVIVEEV